MNVSSWLKKASAIIAPLDAELILLHALQKEDRSFLHAHGDELLSGAQCQNADMLLARRQTGEPLAYILGYKEFYGRRFAVSPDVLIPRPETEVIINLVKQIAAAPDAPQKLKILDVGTGSGCIITTLTLELGSERAEYFACDISTSALALARQNAQDLGASAISFCESDLLSAPQLAAQKFDIIVANLPYVDPDWAWLDHKTLDFEPSLALYASDDGLALIKKLIASAPSCLRKGGYLILESDQSQHSIIISYAQNYEFSLSPLYSAQTFAIPLRFATN